MSGVDGGVFAQVRRAVSAQDAARRFGLEFDRKGWCRCPFHHDRHASMSFKNGRWRCWVCNEGGDSIDLTARLLGLTPLEAVERLNGEFSLGLALHGRPTAQQRQAARRRQEVAEAQRRFELWREETIWRLNACFRTAHLAMQDLRSPADLDRLTPEQVLAIREQARFEYLSDLLTGGTPAEQLELFHNREEIFTCAEKILNPMQTKLCAA